LLGKFAIFQFLFGATQKQRRFHEVFRRQFPAHPKQYHGKVYSAKNALEQFYRIDLKLIETLGVG
jgi:hypothetical protein